LLLFSTYSGLQRYCCPLNTLFRTRSCKRLRSPGIDSNESIPPGWESIPGLLTQLTLWSLSHNLCGLCLSLMWMSLVLR